MTSHFIIAKNLGVSASTVSLSSTDLENLEIFLKAKDTDKNFNVCELHSPLFANYGQTFTPSCI